MPQSYGTLSHLCASVAQLSALSMPAVSRRSARDAPAHRPNAPSTCTHAPRGFTASQISPTGSNAPVLMLPAWVQTIAGPSIRGSSDGFIRPCASVATRRTRSRPSPSMPSDLNSVGCASSLTTSVTGGAPIRPSASTFQPTSARTRCRAAASAVKFATVAPVTKPAPLPAGSPSRSTSHSMATCSIVAAAGVTSCMTTF